MNLAGILDALREEGVRLEVKGGNLRLTAPKPPSLDLVNELKSRKTEILAFLKSQAEGGVYVRRFGTEAARLHPSQGRKVQTPKGEGRLWQVFTVSVGVLSWRRRPSG